TRLSLIGWQTRKREEDALLQVAPKPQQVVRSKRSWNKEDRHPAGFLGSICQQLSLSIGSEKKYEIRVSVSQPLSRGHGIEALTLSIDCDHRFAPGLPEVLLDVFDDLRTNSIIRISNGNSRIKPFKTISAVVDQSPGLLFNSRQKVERMP